MKTVECERDHLKKKIFEEITREIDKYFREHEEKDYYIDEVEIEFHFRGTCSFTAVARLDKKMKKQKKKKTTKRKKK
jgi:hypothetical protein